MRVKHIGYGLGIAYLLWSLWWAFIHVGADRFFVDDFPVTVLNMGAVVGIIASIVIVGFTIMSTIFLLMDSEFWNKKLF